MKINKNILILSFLILFLANPVRAAKLYFSSDNTNIKTSNFFELSILIDSEEEQINAIEASINFPADLLKFINIKESDSVINFWIDKPSLVSNNKIKFSGIIPGGYSGQGNLFKLIFKTKQIGQASIDFSDVKILLNDGQGSEAIVNKNILSFQVSDSAPLGDDVVIIDISDQDSPEPFTPVISKIPEIAGDNYLLMFNTQDKGSGIDYYKVKEGYHSFVKAESPYLLRNQDLDTKIIIKAVDKSGNERSVTISPVYPAPWYENFIFFAIIIVVIIISFILGRISKKRKNKKS